VTPVAPALAKFELPQFTNSIGMEFVLIPAGEFMMGSQSSGYEGERPVHPVTISRSFYLGKYLVTQGEWEQVMNENPSRFKTSYTR
jgi:formylglycine-generating enzyme required for sulfatase activity